MTPAEVGRMWAQSAPPLSPAQVMEAARILASIPLEDLMR